MIFVISQSFLMLFSCTSQVWWLLSEVFLPLIPTPSPDIHTLLSEPSILILFTVVSPQCGAQSWKGILAHFHKRSTGPDSPCLFRNSHWPLALTGSWSAWHAQSCLLPPTRPLCFPVSSRWLLRISPILESADIRFFFLLLLCRVGPTEDMGLLSPPSHLKSGICRDISLPAFVIYVVHVFAV